MDFLLFEIPLILMLILANGFFSAAEIAIVSLRTSRISQLIDERRRGAQTASVLKNEPSSFLATVQIGVTIVGSMASVIGGAGAVEILAPALQGLPLIGAWAGAIALGVTVAVISYLTLVLGELVPKSIGLRYTEGFALSSAPLIFRLSRLFSPVVRLLTWSTNLVLRAFGGERQASENLFSEEEVKHIVREGAKEGIFDEAEHQLIHSVFEFTDTSVREVMVPRSDIYAVERGTSLQELLDRLTESGFSRVPVFEGDLDHIVGVVHLKDLLRRMRKDSPASVSEVMHPALFVPDSMQISDLLRDLQSRRAHMAVVLNEFGTVIGLVTIEDLLEEIVGEIRDEFDSDEELPIQELPDGSLLVEGSVLLTDLNEKHGLGIEQSDDYRTVAGFVLARLRRIPKGGEALVWNHIRMTVVTIDGRRLRKVRIEKEVTGDG